MKLVSSCLLCTLLSCIPNYYGTTINEDSYVSRKYNKLKLVITTADLLTDVNYIGNLEPEFGPGDSKTLITNHFFKALKNNINFQCSK